MTDPSLVRICLDVGGGAERGCLVRGDRCPLITLLEIDGAISKGRSRRRYGRGQQATGPKERQEKERCGTLRSVATTTYYIFNVPRDYSHLVLAVKSLKVGINNI